MEGLLAVLLGLGAEGPQLAAVARAAIQEAATTVVVAPSLQQESLPAAAGRWYVERVLLDQEAWGVGFSEPRHASQSTQSTPCGAAYSTPYDVTPGLVVAMSLIMQPATTLMKRAS